MIIEQDIETARLRLAPLDVGDASALSEMTDNPATLGAILFLERPFTPDAAERLLAGADNLRDAFVGARLRADGTLAAVVGVHLRDVGEMEIGYWVRLELQGQVLPPRRRGPSSRACARPVPTAGSSPNVAAATRHRGACCTGSAS